MDVGVDVDVHVRAHGLGCVVDGITLQKLVIKITRVWLPRLH